MSKNPLQSLTAKLSRSAANDDAAPRERESGGRDQRDHGNRDHVNMVTAMPPPDTETGDNTWTGRLVLFLRVMAVLSMVKGLYHWAQITGFVGGEDGSFEYQTTQWQTATVYFAVIELVAAVGLWLATPWGAVVWLTTIVSTAVIELMFPTIYGGNIFAVLVAAILLLAYLALAWMAARERPP
jgi:hypothetical protein